MFGSVGEGSFCLGVCFEVEYQVSSGDDLGLKSTQRENDLGWKSQVSSGETPEVYREMIVRILSLLPLNWTARPCHFRLLLVKKTDALP